MPVKRVEPSLLRSVLILNTLKHIEVELQNDGVQTSGADSSSFSLDDNSDIAMDILPDMHTINHDVVVVATSGSSNFLFIPMLGFSLK
jgi:hypothetical protein